MPSLEESLRILRTTHTKRAPRAGPSVKKQVQPLLKSLQEKFEAHDDGAARLKSRWTEIVGLSLGRLCEPVRIIKGRKDGGGTLEIRVGGAYAPLLQHQASSVLDRINLYLGRGAVTRLRLVQAPLTTPPRTPPPPRPQPLSAAEELLLQQSVADVGDARLRNALLRLGRAVTLRVRQGGHN